MRTRRTGLYPDSRLERGAAILAVGETVDVTLIKRRWEAFAAAHAAYAGAHGGLEAAETQLREHQTVVNQRDAEQDQAIERLARALVTEGHTRANPFAAFGVPSPSMLQDLRYGEKAKAIHALAGILRADSARSKATPRVALAADDVARRMEAELVSFEKLQATTRTARAARDLAGDAWEKAVQALRHDVRAAALIDGTPALGRALFPRPTRSKGKSAAPSAGNGVSAHGHGSTAAPAGNGGGAAEMPVLPTPLFTA